MEALKQYLKSRPDIQDVYLNENGGWVFSPNNQFPVHITRKDILEGEVDDSVLGVDVLNTVKVLEEKNQYLSDQVALLQLEKEGLEAEKEALKQENEVLKMAAETASSETQQAAQPEAPTQTEPPAGANSKKR